MLGGKTREDINNLKLRVSECENRLDRIDDQCKIIMELLSQSSDVIQKILEGQKRNEKIDKLYRDSDGLYNYQHFKRRRKQEPDERDD